MQLTGMITVTSNMDSQTLDLLKQINVDLQQETNNIMILAEKELKTSRQDLASAKKRMFILQEELSASQASVKRLKHDLEESDAWMSEPSFTSTPVKSPDQDSTPAINVTPLKAADEETTPAIESTPVKAADNKTN